MGVPILFIIGCFLFVEAPDIVPVQFYPPEMPQMVGILAHNQELTNTKLLAKGQLVGPEDIAITNGGVVFTANGDGWIKSIQTDGSVQNFANTQGRPLGLKFSPDNNLIVADGALGLLSISPDGSVTSLVQNNENHSFGLVDDLDVDFDGNIYFSDATIPELRNDYYHDILIHRPFGRLLRFDPSSGDLTVLLDSLFFANGVALSHDEDFVLVAETSQYQITRFWLKGERKGEKEVFAENLPGFPDGIMGDGRGNYWVALVSPRKWDVDNIYAPRVWLRKILMHLPEWIRPAPTPYGLVIRLNREGEIINSLHDPSGKTLSQITNVVEHNGLLYLGTLTGDAVGMYKL